MGHDLDFSGLGTQKTEIKDTENRGITVVQLIDLVAFINEHVDNMENGRGDVEARKPGGLAPPSRSRTPPRGDDALDAFGRR